MLVGNPCKSVDWWVIVVKRQTSAIVTKRQRMVLHPPNKGKAQIEWYCEYSVSNNKTSTRLFQTIM